MFAPLPTGFSRLERVLEEMGQIKLLAPPDLGDIGVRMRELYARARTDGYLGLSRGALRRLPYALWLNGARPLEQIDGRLVEAYWQTHLPRALEQPRAAKRWLGPLLYVYCHWFDRARPGFLAFSRRVLQVVQAARGAFAEFLQDLHARMAWFSPEQAGAGIGRALLNDPAPLAQTVERMNLWPGFLEEPLASDAFASALRPTAEALTDPARIQRLLSWSRTKGPRSDDELPRYPEQRVALADAMVRPWLSRQPPPEVRSCLMTYFIKHYGDPRPLSGPHLGHHWQGVSEATITQLKRWLVGDTLRGFMRLLQLTADDIWKYRERFWMAYYERGYIEEAWPVLGTMAAWRARREMGENALSGHGVFTAGATSDQSMLFLRIGHLVFMEWSHNGSLRAYVHGDPGGESLYGREYSGHTLRTMVSMDFHNGLNANPQLAHMNSEGGTWQRKARDFIATHTGVKLNDRDILG